MTTRQFQQWRERCGFPSWEAAGRAIGISRRQTMRYVAGREIPLTVALACWAVEAQRKAT